MERRKNVEKETRMMKESGYLHHQNINIFYFQANVKEMTNVSTRIRPTWHVKGDWFILKSQQEKILKLFLDENNFWLAAWDCALEEKQFHNLFPDHTWDWEKTWGWGIGFKKNLDGGPKTKQKFLCWFVKITGGPTICSANMSFFGLKSQN